MAASERQLEVNGVTLRFLEANPGARPLLLVHGFTGRKEDFADHVDALAEAGWHVVAPDLRGHGASEHPPGEGSYTFAIFAADLLALASALGWERFTLLGHSMGGMVAQVLALADEVRLHGLVLMDTTHGPRQFAPAPDIEAGKEIVRGGGMTPLLEAQKERGGVLDTPAHVRLLAKRPGYAEYCDAGTLAASPDMWLSMVDQLRDQPDRLDRLAKLGVPVLVIVGEQDEPFLGDCRRMAEAIPGAELAIIPDAGHSPQFENANAWWEALQGFLDRLGSR